MRQLGEDSTMIGRLGKQARKDYIENFDFAHIVKTKLMPLYERRH